MASSYNPESDAVALERYLNVMRTQDALAKELEVSRNYISAMKREGFKTPGGKASIRMARTFLEECPEFNVKIQSTSPK